MLSLLGISLLCCNVLIAFPESSNAALSEQTLNEFMTSFFETVLRRENLEVVMVSDQELPKTDIAIINYDLGTLRAQQVAHKEAELCPVFRAYAERHNDTEESEFIPENKNYVRKQLIPKIKRARLYVFLLQKTESIKLAQTILKESVLVCKQKIEAGMYNRENKIVFITENNEHTLQVFEDKLILRHPQVACLQRFDRAGEMHFGIFRSWGFQGIYAGGQAEEIVSQAFQKQSSFHTDTIQVAILPWAHYILADSKINATATDRYDNFWGYEAEVLKELRKAYGFKVEYSNPLDEEWGRIREDDGTWTGMIGLTAREQTDIVISDCLMSFTRTQVIDSSDVYDKDYLGWVSPAPHLLPTYLSLIHPLQPFVWLLTVLSLIVVGIILYYVEKYEALVCNRRVTRDWDTVKECVWYCYGTLLGESITRDTKSHQSPGLRIILFVWILYCLIMGSSYAGNLKAYLTTPSYSDPLNTLQSILDSDLPIGIVLYGEEEEGQMAVSTDPIIQEIWNRKHIVDFSPTPDVSSVYKGEKVLIDFYSGVVGDIFMKYTKPGTGESLVYLSTDPVFAFKFSGIGFSKVNPWTEQFNKVIRSMIESGLIDQWKVRTWRQMRQNMLTRGEKPVEVKERPAISALTLGDLQGIMFLLCLFLLSALIPLFWERKAAKRAAASGSMKNRDNISDTYST